MATPRISGNLQIATQVTAGLRRAVEERAIREGLTISIITRRALMQHLGVDANGKPIKDGKR